MRPGVVRNFWADFSTPRVAATPLPATLRLGSRPSLRTTPQALAQDCIRLPPVSHDPSGRYGKEIYLTPMRHYMKSGLTFLCAALKASSKRYNEIVLSCKGTCDNDFGIILNQTNDDAVHPSAHDMVIILAESLLE